MTQRIRAVLFDLDDTLFDRNKAVEKTLVSMAREFPHLFSGLDTSRILKVFIASDDIAMLEYKAGASIDESRLARNRIFLKTLGRDEKYAEALNDFYVGIYPSFREFLPGARETIERLAKTVKLGVITNGSPDVQYRKLENLGVRHLLACIIVSEEVGIRKPDAGIFQKADECLKEKPGNILFVGDSYDADIAGAKNAGLKACWFNPNSVPRPRNDIAPDFEIKSLSQIPDLIENNKI
jgi:HAD superfamily hydrolase (TIGR01549 family)